MTAQWVVQYPSFIGHFMCEMEQGTVVSAQPIFYMTQTYYAARKIDKILGSFLQEYEPQKPQNLKEC